MRRALCAALCGLAVVGAQAEGGPRPWVADKLDDEAVASVWTYIDHKDCGGAVKELNAGVAKKYPGVLLLAGSMFEEGVCVKLNWPRALDFYERAHAAGHPHAAARIASGYAMPAAGPDPGATLWWALKGRQALPKACLDVASLVDDADRFVQGLQAWPRQRLDACAYVAAVVSTITGDLEFSGRAEAYGLRGSLVATFHPAQGQVDVRTDELDFIQMGGLVSGNAVRDRESKLIKLEFERDIRSAADRALRRYARPSGIDPSWVVAIVFNFSYVVR
jgi:hypothetical protein